MAQRTLACQGFSLLRLAVRAILITALIGCSGNPPPNPAQVTEPQPQVRASTLPPPRQNITPSKLWPVGGALLNNAALKAEVFNAHIHQLLKQPIAENLKFSQEAWRDTANAIEQFYLLSRLGMAEPKHFQSLLDGQFNIAAWPIQPGYIDSYGKHIYSGLIFDIGMPLGEAVIRRQHGMTDKADATLGIYAIEYLLFGTQNKRSALIFREITALSKKNIDKGYQAIEELPRNRRRELLRFQSKMLADDIAKLRMNWTNKQPTGLMTRFQSLSKENQQVLIIRATQNTLTEQIIAIANLQTSSKTQSTDLTWWNSQQLAGRISAQLKGLALITAESSEKNIQRLSKAAQQCSKITASISTLAPVAKDGQTTKIYWKEVYGCVRQLSHLLEPKT